MTGTLHAQQPHRPTRTRIKICGLTREEAVDAAVAFGADAVGFVLYPGSKRCVSPARAAELGKRLPAFVTPVLLFVNANASDVIAACAGLAGATVQFHGDETPEDCWRASDRGRIPYIRAARIPLGAAGTRFDLVKYAHDYSHASAILLDAHVEGYGGAARHSIGHCCHQTSTLTSFCLVDLHLQTWAMAYARSGRAARRWPLT